MPNITLTLDYYIHVDSCSVGDGAAGRVGKVKKGRLYYFGTAFQRKGTSEYARICEQLSQKANGGNA